MLEVLGMIYLWLKAGHILFVIFWMAGLFMLPRFFIYHQEQAVSSAEWAAWVEREARLRRIILTPSLVAVWGFGLALAYVSNSFHSGWFAAKLIVVLALTGYHGWMVSYAKGLAQGNPGLSGKKLRLLNEVPGLAAVLVIILVVVRPF